MPQTIHQSVLKFSSTYTNPVVMNTLHVSYAWHIVTLKMAYE